MIPKYVSLFYEIQMCINVKINPFIEIHPIIEKMLRFIQLYRDQIFTFASDSEIHKTKIDEITNVENQQASKAYLQCLEKRERG